MNNVRMDLPEQFKEYQDELERDLPKLEMEVNSIKLTLEKISKPQIAKIEDLIRNSENNVSDILTQ
jgi:hypothetical protein